MANEDVRKRFYKMGIVKVGFKDTTLLDMCKHIGEVKLFGYIVSKMNKESLDFVSNEKVKDDILKELDLSRDTVNRYLSNLCEYKLLIKLSRGYYRVNKRYLSFIDDRK